MPNIYTTSTTLTNPDGSGLTLYDNAGTAVYTLTGNGTRAIYFVPSASATYSTTSFTNTVWWEAEDWIVRLAEARAVLLRYYLLRKTLLRTGFHGLALKPC